MVHHHIFIDSEKERNTCTNTHMHADTHCLFRLLMVCQVVCMERLLGFIHYQAFPYADMILGARGCCNTHTTQEAIDRA